LAQKDSRIPASPARTFQRWLRNGSRGTVHQRHFRLCTFTNGVKGRKMKKIEVIRLQVTSPKQVHVLLAGNTWESCEGIVLHRSRSQFVRRKCRVAKRFSGVFANSWFIQACFCTVWQNNETWKQFQIGNFYENPIR